VLLYLAHQHAASLLFYSAKDTGLLKRVKPTASKFNKSEACLTMLCALPGHQHAASLLFYSAKDTELLKRVKQTASKLNKSKACLYLVHQHAASLLFYSDKDMGLIKREKQTANKFNKSKACLSLLCVALPGTSACCLPTILLSQGHGTIKAGKADCK
jgi:hypothetical protein